MRAVPVSEALGVELLDFDIKRPSGAGGASRSCASFSVSTTCSSYGART